jgi:hypothetical protein
VLGKAQSALTHAKTQSPDHTFADNRLLGNVVGIALQNEEQILGSVKLKQASEYDA